MENIRKTLITLLAGGIAIAGTANMAMNYEKKEACREYSQMNVTNQSRAVQERYAHEKFTTKAKKGLFGVSEQIRYPFIQAEMDLMDYCKDFKENNK